MAILNRQTGRSGPRASLYPWLRRGELTGPEIRDAAPAPDEGFSVRTTGPGVGRVPRDVFSTGFAPDTGRSAEVALSGNRSAAEQLREFNERNIDVLGTPGASMAIGGWSDPATGVVGMDTSVLTPRTPEGFHTAMQIGVQSGQAAIGNLGKKGYEGDVNIPHYLQKDQYKGPMGYDPLVEDLGVSDTGRRRVRITPGLKEATQVEADVMLSGGVPVTGPEGSVTRQKLTPKPFKEKGAGQYVKESLGFTRKARKKSMYKGRPTTY